MAAAAFERPIDILLVEDNPGDVVLTRSAIQSIEFDCKLSSVPDGASAIAYLQRQEPYREAPRPNLVLLDLNLPGIKGSEVLRFIKSAEEIRDIPVIILSTSGDPYDVAASYHNHANCFIRKPSGFDDYRRVMREIEDFWFSIVELPAT